MTVFYPEPITRVNDVLHLKNGDSNPIYRDVINDAIPGKPNDNSRYQADFYKYFGLDIVTETVYDYPYPFITEKTMRPITSKRPFIVVGAPNILDLLKDKGFKTFNTIIDESYDSIIDPSDRFDSVCISIHQFVTQPIEKIRADVISISNTLEHNFKTYLALEDIELLQINI